MNQRLRVLQDLGVQIEALAARAPARESDRRRRLVAIAIAIALLAFAAAALAATGAFTTGAPVRAGATDLTNPRSGYGAVSARGVSAIVARAADPAGGPPWGMRVIGTTRGVACLQVGRVVNGQLGVLGEDGLFRDDGRFHPLPAAVNTPSPFCFPPDANGNLFVSTEYAPLPASGYGLKFAFQGRQAAIAPPGGCSDGSINTTQKLLVCPAADERAIFFGMLGPHAAAITYTSAGRRRTVATGTGGAYVVALPASKGLDGGMSSITPQPGAQPIREITYRDRTTCEIPVQANGTPCPPVGYLAPRIPQAAQVVAPLHVTHAIHPPTRPGGPAIDELRVDFMARVAIRNDQDAYILVVQRPVVGKCIAGGEIGTGTDTDIAAGDRVKLRIAGERLGPCPGGAYTGTVYYQQNSLYGATPAMLSPSLAGRHDPYGADLKVGHFTFSEP
jgi:hypothetical protein